MSEHIKLISLAAVFASRRGVLSVQPKRPFRKKVQPPKPAYRKTLKGGY